MSSVVCGWKAELIETFPKLFRTADHRPGAARGMPDCSEGWRDLLRRLCIRIGAALEVDGGSLRFVQINEKSGTLRVRWDGKLSSEARAQVDEAVALAEARAGCTCEICGEPGSLYRGDWLTTRCAMHAQGRARVRDRRGFERVHLVSYVAGEEILVVCRRYDRDTDAFVAVDPAFFEIEEA